MHEIVSKNLMCEVMNFRSRHFTHAALCSDTHSTCFKKFQSSKMVFKIIGYFISATDFIFCKQKQSKYSPHFSLKVCVLGMLLVCIFSIFESRDTKRRQNWIFLIDWIPKWQNKIDARFSVSKMARKSQIFHIGFKQKGSWNKRSKVHFLKEGLPKTKLKLNSP